MELSQDKLLETWRMMVLIRKFEERVSVAYAAGKIPGFIHLSIGQEAIAAGTCCVLKPDDYIYVTHRGHGQCLAKGADIRLMMAEIFGKETGYCKGRGGSMHIAAFDKGVLGANGIVGGSFPLALGAGLAIQMRGGKQVVVVFFGDGAANEGAFHESLNIAALWKLPIVYVCENNGYAQFTAAAIEHSQPAIHRHGEPYNIEGLSIDGNQVEAVYQAVSKAIDKARQGGGPTLIECLTYRWHGHYEGDPERYRNADEVAEWKEKDPIRMIEKVLCETGQLEEATIEKWYEEVDSQLAEAVEFAEESPVPDPVTALKDVYV